MKTKKIILSIGLILSLQQAAWAEEITVTVKGMVCSFCAQGIKKSFGKLDAVEKVEPNLESKVVVINTKKDHTLSEDVITKTITDSGFEVLKIERK